MRGSIRERAPSVFKFCSQAGNGAERLERVVGGP
jgi:hypothetical protein